MRTTDEVAAMLRLKALGWGERRIAVALGCNRRTVRRYLAAEGWVGYRRPRRAKALDGLMIGWPSGSGGTADVAAGSVARGELADGGAGGGGTAPGAAGRGAGNDAV
jgi:predicted transcriptional regulator